jgi:hypothetical protein
LPCRANHNDALAHPASPRRGVARDRHDTRGGDAVGMSVLQRDFIARTNNIDVPVKSCGSGLPVLRSSS